MSQSPFVILLIEDDPLDAQLFSELCQNVSADLDVRVRANGQEGLEYLEQGFAGDAATPRPGLIVLDLKMPTMGGHMFLREARRRDHFRLIPTLVLSVSDGEDDIQRSYQNYANDYLIKPDTLDEFKVLIEVVISYWHSAERLSPLGDFH